MGTKNRERRAARKKARDRARGRGQAAPPTADPFEDLFGPPRVTPEMIAVTLADAASAHVRGDGEAIAECTALLLDLPPAQEETVDRGLELAVARAVDQLWTCGWLPLVLVEHARRSPRPTQVGVADDRLLPGLAARASAVDETLGEVFGGLTYRSISVTDAQGWQAGRAAAETASLGLDRDRLDA